MEQPEVETNTALYASLLSTTEVGLGSILHAMHIPFSGQFLSLNQIALLSHAVSYVPVKTIPMTISAIAALLKSLSPIGKRLTPCLALTMQGFLFTIGILLAGRTSLGRALGSSLASIWGFVQPALLYTLIFGENFWHALFYINEKTLPNNSLKILFLGIVACKVVCSIGIALWAPRLPIHYFKKISSYSNTTKTKKRRVHQLLAALLDLLRPSFLLSLGMIAFLFYNTYISSDAVALQLLRPIAIGYIVSVCMRIVPLEKLVAWIHTKSKGSFQKTLEQVQKTMVFHDGKKQ